MPASIDVRSLGIHALPAKTVVSVFILRLLAQRLAQCASSCACQLESNVPGRACLIPSPRLLIVRTRGR
jgi:hypothetical protein